jgi:hypothetical protein
LGARSPALRENPERLRDLFIAVRHDYWTAPFADEWRQLEPKLAAAAAEGEQLIDREGSTLY